MEFRNKIKMQIRKFVITFDNYIILLFSVIVNVFYVFFLKEVRLMEIKKRSITPYGIAIKIKLVEMNKTQNWLIEQLKMRFPDRYFDSSLMYKILTGQVNSLTTIKAINEILSIDENHITNQVQ